MNSRFKITWRMLRTRSHGLRWK